LWDLFSTGQHFRWITFLMNCKPLNQAGNCDGQMKLITSWDTLMHYARELGAARQSGEAERIEKAQKQHDDYRDLCLKADRMSLNTSLGSL